MVEAKRTQSLRASGNVFAVISWVNSDGKVGWKTIKRGISFLDATQQAQAYLQQPDSQLMLVAGPNPSGPSLFGTHRIEKAYVKRDIARDTIESKEEVFKEPNFFKEIAPHLLAVRPGTEEIHHLLDLNHPDNARLLDNLVTVGTEEIRNAPAEPIPLKIRNTVSFSGIFTFPQDFAAPNKGQIVRFTKPVESGRDEIKGGHWEVIDNDYIKGNLKVRQTGVENPKTVKLNYGSWQARGIRNADQLKGGKALDPNVTAWIRVIKEKGDMPKRQSIPPIKKTEPTPLVLKTTDTMTSVVPEVEIPESEIVTLPNRIGNIRGNRIYLFAQNTFKYLNPQDHPYIRFEFPDYFLVRSRLGNLNPKDVIFKFIANDLSKKEMKLILVKPHAGNSILTFNYGSPVPDVEGNPPLSQSPPTASKSKPKPAVTPPPSLIDDILKPQRTNIKIPPREE